MGNKKVKAAKHELSDEDVEYLTTNTKFDRSTVIEWYESLFKDYSDGKVNKEAFANVYRKLYPFGDPTKFSSRVFDLFDTDKSGFITFRELLLAIAVMSDGDLSKRLDMAFRLIDSNNDKFIDKTETIQVVRAIYDLNGLFHLNTQVSLDERAQQFVELMFSQMDKDEDAKLSREEFVNGLLKESLVVDAFLPPKPEITSTGLYSSL